MLDVNVSLVKPLPTLTASRCVSESSIKASARVCVRLDSPSFSYQKLLLSPSLYWGNRGRAHAEVSGVIYETLSFLDW